MWFNKKDEDITKIQFANKLDYLKDMDVLLNNITSKYKLGESRKS